ncbi:hypothetical protein HN51_069200 [Arachis hypogaea]
MKKGYSCSVAVAFNTIICVFMMLLLWSSSMNAVAMRPLKDESSSAPNLTFMGSISRAYSGPSHRGRGH